MKNIRTLMLLVFCSIHFLGWSQSNKTAIPKKTIENGKQVYNTRCLACHQVEGGGVPHLNPPLDGASAVVAKNKANLIKIVLHGNAEKREIDGEYYSNIMAPHSDLSNQQIADVLTYIRNNWTNKASVVNAAEVKSIRAKLK